MADAHDDVVVLTPGEEEKLLEESAQDEVPAVSISFTKPESDATASLQAIEGVIRRQSDRLDKLQEDLKTINDQIKSILDNDEELSKVQEEVKVAAAKQKQRKSSLSNSAESMQLKYKQKDLKESIKDVASSLSNHLVNLYQMTGAKEFDSDDGTRREFEVSARLRGKKKQD